MNLLDYADATDGPNVIAKAYTRHRRAERTKQLIAAIACCGVAISIVLVFIFLATL